MNDNALFTLIFSLLQSGLTDIGMGSILLQQSYQPTQEGVPTPPTLFVYKVGDERMGFPARNSTASFGSATFQGSITGNVLNVLSLTTGGFELGQQIKGAGFPSNLVITAFDTGTGGVGTYYLNYAPGNKTPQAMTAGPAQVYTETQQYITSFQMSSLATQDPANTESLTASDILNYGISVLQSGNTIAALEAQGVGILNISQIRNPYFSDDRQRYEASPNADFRLTHKQIVTTVVPVVTSDEIQILSV